MLWIVRFNEICGNNEDVVVRNDDVIKKRRFHRLKIVLFDRCQGTMWYKRMMMKCFQKSTCFSVNLGLWSLSKPCSTKTVFKFFPYLTYSAPIALVIFESVCLIFESVCFSGICFNTNFLWYLDYLNQTTNLEYLLELLWKYF